MNLKTLVQVILLVWFIAINVAILVPSYQLIFDPDALGPANRQVLPQPPAPPPAPAVVEQGGPAPDPQKQKQQEADYQQRVGVYTEQVKAYTQEVTAYTQQVAAHKAQEEARSKTNRLTIYGTVVKDALVTLVAGFATALIAYVFANLGAGVADNYVRVKNGQPPQSIKLL